MFRKCVHSSRKYLYNKSDYVLYFLGKTQKVIQIYLFVMKNYPLIRKYVYKKSPYEEYFFIIFMYVFFNHKICL